VFQEKEVIVLGEINLSGYLAKVIKTRRDQYFASLQEQAPEPELRPTEQAELTALKLEVVCMLDEIKGLCDDGFLPKSILNLWYLQFPVSASIKATNHNLPRR